MSAPATTTRNGTAPRNSPTSIPTTCWRASPTTCSRAVTSTTRLRRLLRSGFRTADGDEVAGLRDLLDQLRRRRQEMLAEGDPDGRMAELTPTPRRDRAGRARRHRRPRRRSDVFGRRAPPARSPTTSPPNAAWRSTSSPTTQPGASSRCSTTTSSRARPARSSKSSSRSSAKKWPTRSSRVRPRRCPAWTPNRWRGCAMPTTRSTACSNSAKPVRTSTRASRSSWRSSATCSRATRRTSTSSSSSWPSAWPPPKPSGTRSALSNRPNCAS